jgi:oxygen-independent coproporphyrinogen-3 oxidase
VTTGLTGAPGDATAGAHGPAPSAASEPIPLSLYVHLPWCLRKCPYCDFNSHALRGPVDQAAYVDALLADLDHECRRADLPPVGSVFIGGGTPSLFEAPMVARLLEGIDRRLELATDVEITLEANPGAAEAERFAGFRRAGVNRLSLGVQSLDDAKLASLGRVHDSAAARDAFAMAGRAGFDNINLDLMYGLPAQRPDEALTDLAQAIALGPVHLSWYQLTLEPNTLFHQRPPSLPDVDQVADIEQAGRRMLADAGFARYEISAFARPGRRCRHNLNYWAFGDYLGIGAGAHGKLTAADGTVVRQVKRRGPAAYQASVADDGGVSSQWQVERADLPLEFMLNALRLVDGVPSTGFAARTGLDLATIAAPLRAARARGLLTDSERRLQPTAQGLAFLNDLLGLFDPEAGVAG